MNRAGVPQHDSKCAIRAPTVKLTLDGESQIKVDTMLVTVPVSVLDRQGRFIPGLKSEDFTLLENGEQQSIAYFETAEKPFTVALLLDTSASTHFQPYAAIRHPTVDHSRVECEVRSAS